MNHYYKTVFTACIAVGLCILTACILLGMSNQSFGQSCNVSAGGNQSMCANDESIQLYGDAESSNPVFSWSTNGDGSFDDASSPTPFYTPGSNDDANQLVQLTLSVTCEEGSSQDIMTLAIIPNPNPVIYGGPLVCLSSMIDAGAGYDYYDWEWSTGSGSNELQEITSSDTYYLTAGNNGCYGYTATYIIAEGGTYNFVSDASIYCTGDMIDFSLDATNPFDMYQLLFDGNPYGSPYEGDPNGGSIDFGSNYWDAGTYTVSSYYCNTLMNGSFTVTENPNPVITGGPLACIGSTIDAGSGYDYYDWEWSTGSGSDELQEITSSDTYYLTTGNNGCYGYTSTYIIAEGGTYNFIESGASLCDASIIDFSMNATNPYDLYQLLLNGNPYSSPIEGDPNGGSIDFGNQTWGAGTYTLSSYYCNTLMNGSYTVLSGPEAGITPNGATTICSNQGHVVFQASPTGNIYSYSWNTPDNDPSTNSYYNADETGYYTVYVTDQISGCSSSTTQGFTVNQSPTPVIAASGATTFCAGGSVTLNAGSYASYHWVTSASTETISVTTSRNYSVTIIDGNGCPGTASKTVTVNPLPTIRISASGTTALCPGTSVALDAGFYSSYLWNTAATTEFINVSNAGTYSVSATNSNGCIGTSSIAVTNVDFPNPVITGASSACSGSTITLGTSATYLTYNWSNGATTSTTGVTTTGTYSVTVTVGTCSSSTSDAVTFLSSPTPSITAMGISSYCTGTGNVTLNAGSPYSSYHWNTNASTEIITITQGNPGTYSVTVSGSNGCTGNTSYVVSAACNAPTIAATPTTNIAATSAMANWILPTCYYGISVRISKHNLNTWTTYTISPNTHYNFSQLSINTSYDWQVRTNCNASQTDVSNWSAIETFTTLARLQDGEIANSVTSFSAYPNPAKDFLNIVFNTDKEDEYNIQLVDITGRTITSLTGNSVIGDNQYQMNLSDISKGIYMIVFRNNNGGTQKKIMIN